MEFLATTEKDLSQISQTILQKILDIKNSNLNKQKLQATIIGLDGDLGSAKTTFTKYFAEHLGISANQIISPTFIIQKRFSISEKMSKQNFFKNFYHLDVYRIENPQEILRLNWQEIISDSQNLILIEWANLIEEILPNDTLKISFETIDETSRKIKTNF